jgi:hypothetical protein
MSDAPRPTATHRAAPADLARPVAGTMPRRIVLLLGRAVVAAALLAWLVDRSGGLAAVWAVVQRARSDLVIAAFGLAALNQLVIAHRLRLVAGTQGAVLGTPHMLAINLAAHFHGLFLPGGGFTASAIRFFRLTRDDRRFTAILVAIVCDRMLATASLGATGLALWLLDGPARSTPALLALLALTGVCAAAMLPMFAAAPARALGALAARLPVVRRAWPGTAAALAAYRAVPAAARAGHAALSLAAHALGVVVYLLLARALMMGIPAVALGWMRSVAGTVTLLPVSISGLGLREGTTTALLAERGVPHADAFGYSLLVFGVTILGIGLLGGVVEAWSWFAPRRATDVPPVT